jgi:hypothetical protein
MDPVTAVVVKAGASWLSSKFKALVIDRWARRRAEAFFESFIEELAANDDAGQPLSDIEPMLAEMLGDELKSEVLFDAYRRVSFSASPSLGPRIIAVLTARLIAGNRVAEPDEERMMLTAEVLNDQDFNSLCTYLSQRPPDKNYEVMLSGIKDSPEWRFEIRIGQVNLGEEVGNWCLKLQTIGLVVQDVMTKSADYEVNSEMHIDIPSTVTSYVRKLRFQPEVLELKSIIEGLRGTAE